MSITKMNKEYIEREYDTAVLDYQTAHSEEERFTARQSMARLETIAMQDYGFDYADKLAKKKEVIFEKMKKTK